MESLLSQLLPTTWPLFCHWKGLRSQFFIFQVICLLVSGFVLPMKGTRRRSWNVKGREVIIFSFLLGSGAGCTIYGVMFQASIKRAHQFLLLDQNWFGEEAPNNCTGFYTLKIHFPFCTCIIDPSDVAFFFVLNFCTIYFLKFLY